MNACSKAGEARGRVFILNTFLDILEIPVISNHCKIEFALERCCSRLLSQFQNDQSGKKLTKRLDKILTEK